MRADRFAAHTRSKVSTIAGFAQRYGQRQTVDGRIAVTHRNPDDARSANHECRVTSFVDSEPMSPKLSARAPAVLTIGGRYRSAVLANAVSFGVGPSPATKLVVFRQPDPASQGGA